MMLKKTSRLEPGDRIRTSAYTWRTVESISEPMVTIRFKDDGLSLTIPQTAEVEVKERPAFHNGMIVHSECPFLEEAVSGTVIKELGGVILMKIETAWITSHGNVTLPHFPVTILHWVE